MWEFHLTDAEKEIQQGVLSASVDTTGDRTGCAVVLITRGYVTERVRKKEKDNRNMIT